MSQKRPLLTLTVAAAGTILAHRFVGYDGKQISTGGGVEAFGVAICDAQKGDDVGLDVMGTTVVEAGGPVTMGADLLCNAQGRAINKPASHTGVKVGKALSAAQGAGALIEVLLVH